MTIKFEASNKLEAFINVLKDLNDHPKVKGLREIVTILEKMKSNPRINAEVETSDNKISGYIISIITVYPEIMNHPRSNSLRQFIWGLKPISPITNVPAFIWEKFFNVPLEQKPTIKSRRI